MKKKVNACPKTTMHRKEQKSVLEFLHNCARSLSSSPNQLAPKHSILKNNSPNLVREILRRKTFERLSHELKVSKNWHLPIIEFALKKSHFGSEFIKNYKISHKRTFTSSVISKHKHLLRVTIEHMKKSHTSHIFIKIKLKTTERDEYEYPPYRGVLLLNKMWRRWI